MSGGQMEVLLRMKLKLEGLDISVWVQVQVHFETDCHVKENRV